MTMVTNMVDDGRHDWDERTNGAFGVQQDDWDGLRQLQWRSANPPGNIVKVVSF
jgi:hypothetical protein